MNVRIKNHAALALCATALLASALTGIGHAQAIDELMQNATNRANNAWGYVLNSVGFIGGGGLLAGSLFTAYRKHSGTAGSNTGYGRILAAAVVGTCLLGLTFYERTASTTVFGSKATITGTQQKITFDQ